MYFRLDDLRVVEPLSWLLSCGRRGAPTWPTDTTSWIVLVDYVEANGLGSVFARQLTKRGPQPPAELQRRLEQLDRDMSATARVSLEQARLVGDMLRVAQVPFYWLKGVAWGDSLYRNLGTRPMRDLDFLVPERFLQPACEVLEALGYRTDALAGLAGHHLPRFTHSSGTKIDVHHRIVPQRIYGFPVQDPRVPWSPSNGIVGEDSNSLNTLFHLAHMVVHVFHHSFYNLRLMHLFDIRLALGTWGTPASDVVEVASRSIPRRVALDVLGLCDELFDLGGDFRHYAGRRSSGGLIRNGSMPLGYPVTRVPRLAVLPAIMKAEFERGFFVLRRAPGRFGRPPAKLHPPS